VLELAGANAIELAEAADIVTNTMNMFQLQVEDLNKVNDVLSATCANSATNITDLYEAMKYAGSTANLFGISIEETSAALGVLANMGIKGSDAGTALRNMLLRLAAPTTKAADVLREYGLEIDQTTIKMDGLEKTIKKLYDSGIGNDVAALQALFGK
jgi:TP901 family phage tail tape measure protein